MLQGVPDAAFGAAIISADLLARERLRAEALGRAVRSRGSRLTALKVGSRMIGLILDYRLKSWRRRLT